MRRPKTPLILTLQLGPLTEEEANHDLSDVRGLYADYSTHGPTSRLYEQITALCRTNRLSDLRFDGHLMQLVLDTSHLPRLPDGYFFKGGAARSALQRALGRPYTIRDVDIVRFGNGWSARDNEVSRAFMHEDWERGHGVEISRGTQAYLSSRDLTINELYLCSSSLTLTLGAFLDSLGLVVRPSRYRSGTLSRPRMLPSRTAAKVIRLKAEGRALGLDWTVLGLSGTQEVALIDLAFEMNKCAASGKDAVREFIALSVRANLLPEKLAAAAIEEVVGYILENDPDARRLMDNLVCAAADRRLGEGD